MIKYLLTRNRSVQFVDKNNWNQFQLDQIDSLMVDVVKKIFNF